MSAPRPDGNALEWAIAAVSALLVLVLIGFFVHEALTRTGTRPLLTVTLEAVMAAPEGHAALIGVRNEGHATAAAVEIVGEVGERIARVRLDYVPAESRREATLVFEEPFAPEDLVLRVVGFTDP